MSSGASGNKIKLTIYKGKKVIKNRLTEIHLSKKVRLYTKHLCTARN